VQSCKICSIKNIKSIAGLDGICEKCSIKILAFNRYYESNIPIEYWELSMSEFKGPEIFKKLYTYYIENLHDIYSKGFNCSILSNHGTGKTTVSTSILRVMAQKNYNCLYTTLTDMVNVLIEAPFEEKFIAKKELSQVDILVIDELDSRFFTASENTATLFGKSLENIIRTRFSNKLPNIFVSNSPNMLEGFHGPFKDSLGSLMSGVKEFIARGDDFRKTQGK
jgi:DNA replication protein DnaC